MHGNKHYPESAGSTDDTEGPTLRQQWPVLAVLLLGLTATSIDHTILNVALPEMVRSVKASSSDLQWVVDAYTLVFAGFLLLAGSMGDRRGRKHAFLAGLIGFGVGSVVAASATSATMVIAGRAIMGLGAAFIMPATLSILVNVFTGRRERTRAIAAWTACSSLGIAAGPLLGGFLMRSHSWSAVFWINVPLIAVALVVGMHVLPDSRDPHASKPDTVGGLLSIAAVATLVWAIIEAPASGWTSPATLTRALAATVLTGAFIRWEARRDEPLIDLSVFRAPQFLGASVAMTLAFLALAGSIFLVVQYLQFVLGYTPLAAGFAMLPAAMGLMFGTGVGAHLGAHLRARGLVTLGITVASAGVAVQAAFADGTAYTPTGVGLGLLGLGLGIAMPAATESIMGSLPKDKAGVGSAVNDTARELGGAIGVAVIGSLLASTYRHSITPVIDRLPGVSGAARTAAVDNIGGALEVAHRSGDGQLASAAQSAFVDGMHFGLWAAAVITAVGAITAYLLLPRTGATATVPSHQLHGAPMLVEPEPVVA